MTRPTPSPLLFRSARPYGEGEPVDVLLADLEGHAKLNPAIYLLPPKPATPVAGPGPSAAATKGIRPLAEAERARVFGQ